MAGSTGLEPAASGVTGRRSNQLNYDPNGAITQLVNGEFGNWWITFTNSPIFQNHQLPGISLWWAVQDSNL